MHVRKVLEQSVGLLPSIQLNDIDIDPLQIKAIMINEVVPADPAQDFYGKADADYLSTTLPLFHNAGLSVQRIEDILQMGIYITNAVKTPKTDYTIEKSAISESLPYLEKELRLFPNVQVIMLMGDVAKKAFNLITKKATKKNAVPATATYKLRNSEIYYGAIRILPSYIMTGGNILIEKSKFAMASEDIALMARLIKQ